MGDPGMVGPAGPQGPAGPSGPQGAAGAQGPQGLQGAQGAVGAQGAAGAQGPQGLQGLQGATGAQGPQGATGAQGPQGVAGPQGPRGLTGVTGAQGPAGPEPIVFSVNNVQLGVLLSAMPGNEMYVALGDSYTLVPDGSIVSMARTKVWYANNDCTGQAYAVETNGYEPIAQFVYVGYFNVMYTAATARASATPLALGSYSVGATTCTALNVPGYAHTATSVGSAVDPTATLPWHVVLQ